MVLAKFVSGFAAVATTVAGQTRTSARQVLLFDTLGASHDADCGRVRGDLSGRAPRRHRCA